MEVPYSWLKEFVNLRKSPEVVAQDLSLSVIGVKGIKKTGSESILDLDVTYNRGDLLSILGVARELATLYNLRLKNAREKFKPPAHIEELRVESNKKLSRLYTLARISSLNYKSTPSFIQERLDAAGMRSVNNLWADLTNYVMLEYGQPFHAFDAEKIARRDSTLSIKVRYAKSGETIKTLDGLDRNLSQGDIVIADQKGPIAIAGVMGGEDTEVDQGTTEILLEAAIFDPIAIRKTARRLGLRSEASNRFEHSLSSENLFISLGRIIDLYQLYGKGKVTEFSSLGEKDSEPYSVGLTHEKLTAIAGEAIPLSKARNYLERLGFKVMASERGLLCWPPYFREDIRIPEDVAEEVLRIHGYENVSPRPIQTVLGGALVDKRGIWGGRIKTLLGNLGFYETKSFPFVSTQSLQHLDQKNLLRLRNPISPEAEYLRPNLLFSLLEVAKKNSIRQSTGGIFELERVYPKEREVSHLGVLLWGEENPFLKIKGILEAIAKRTHLSVELVSAKNGFFHPVEAAEIKVDKETLGFLGTLHPHLSKSFEIRGVGVLEIDFEKLTELAQQWGVFTEVSQFQEIYEEYSFTLSQEHQLGNLIKQLREISKLIRDIELADHFTTKEGKRSVTLKITFQSEENVLSTEEIIPLRKSIESRIQKSGGVLRS